MDAGQLREFTLSLPGAEKHDHGGRPSIRVQGRPRFAAGLDEGGISAMPGEAAIREAVAEGLPRRCHRLGQFLPGTVNGRIRRMTMHDDLPTACTSATVRVGQRWREGGCP